MKCHRCEVERKNMENVYDHTGGKVVYQLCQDCVKKAEEEYIEYMGGILEWKEDAPCPSCRGKLRRQGDTDTSVIEMGSMIHYAVTYFNPITMVTRFATGLGKFIFSKIKGEWTSILRQCSKCDAYATKCPKCSQILIPGGKPKIFDGISTKCPKCGQKIIAYE